MGLMDVDPDEEFSKIMEGVELQEPEGAVDYTTLDDVELSRAYDAVRRELHTINEMKNLNPRGRAADLHSQFSAINAELRRRHPLTH